MASPGARVVLVLAMKAESAMAVSADRIGQKIYGPVPARTPLAEARSSPTFELTRDVFGNSALALLPVARHVLSQKRMKT